MDPEQLQDVWLSVVDACRREHVVKVFFPAEFPKKEPRAICELPYTVSLSWPTNIRPGQYLKHVYRVYKNEVAKLQSYFNEMDELDR